MEAYVLSIFFVSIFLLFLVVYQKRIASLLMWPFVIYGPCFLLAYYVQGTSYPFSEIYNDENIVVSQLLIFISMCIIYVLDCLFFSKGYLQNKIVALKSRDNLLIVDVLNSSIYKIYVLIQVILMLGLIAISYQTGEMTYGNYDYKRLGDLKYWGAMSFFVENLTVAISIYLYGIFLFKKSIKRNYWFEVLVAISFIIRLSFGTRSFLVKMLMFVFMMYILLSKKKNYIKISLWGIIALIILSIISFTRALNMDASINVYDINTFLQYVYGSMFLEGYFNDLTLLIASKTFFVFDFDYNPNHFIYFFTSLLPSIIADREYFSNTLLSYDEMVKAIGENEVSPVGGMSFLADLIYGAGPMFFLPIIIIISFIYVLVREMENSYWFCFVLLLSEFSFNFWRDSFYYFNKMFFTHGLLNMFILFIIFKIMKGEKYDC